MSPGLVGLDSGVQCVSLQAIIFYQVRALYKGMMAPMASVSAMNAVFFGAYTAVLKYIDDDLETPLIS